MSAGVFEFCFWSACASSTTNVCSQVLANKNLSEVFKCFKWPGVCVCTVFSWTDAPTSSERTKLVLQARYSHQDFVLAFLAEMKHQPLTLTCVQKAESTAIITKTISRLNACSNHWFNCSAVFLSSVSFINPEIRLRTSALKLHCIRHGFDLNGVVLQRVGLFQKDLPSK
eukprot:3675105-Amphidinium_carterae.1